MTVRLSSRCDRSAAVNSASWTGEGSSPCQMRYATSSKLRDAASSCTA